MRNLAKAVNLVFSSILVVSFSLASQDSFSQTENAESGIKLGVWEVDNGMDCTETFTFLSDRELLLESGPQIATKAYKLKPYRRTGFYVFSQRTTSHNGQVNCVGSMGMKIDSRFKVYIRLNETGNEMSFYTSTSEKDKINVVARKRAVDLPAEGIDESDVVYDTPIEF